MSKSNFLFLKKYWFQISFVVILLLAIILRFPFLSTFPPSMVQDEVGIGYAAVSIAETGMDEWGESYPLIFKSFGDYKTPLHVYFVALLYKLIGWQEALPRIASAIQGVFVVAFGSLWIRKIFKSDKFGILGGLILATSPWAVHISRMGFEINLGLALFTGGLLFLSYSNESIKKLILSGLFFGLSTYSYHSYRYTVVIFLLSLIFFKLILNYKKIKRVIPTVKNIFTILLISTLLSLPGFMSTGVNNRLDQTLIITSDKYIRLYEHYENNCHVTAIELNPKLTYLCKLKYNKFTRQALIGLDSFTQFLSPEFLFFSGDEDILRNPIQSGEFYLTLFPFWMIGILLLFKHLKKYQLLLVGYFVAILPAAMSGPPHAIRLTMLIPFATGVIIVGYKYLEKYFKKPKLFGFIFVLLILLHLGQFVLSYAVDTFATHEITSTYLSYAKKTALLEKEYVDEGYSVYADHNLYPEPHIYYAYFNRIDPKITQESFAKVYEESAGFSRPKQFGEKVFFEEGNIDSIDCKQDEIPMIVFFAKDKQEYLKPTKVIKDNTGLYDFVYIYTSDDICKQKTNSL